MIKSVKPFLRWVGGKTLTMVKYEKYFPVKVKEMIFIDLFVGSGSILFYFKPKKALIADFNKKLINVYKVIKNDPRKLIDYLKQHSKMDSRDHFNDIKERFNKLHFEDYPYYTEDKLKEISDNDLIQNASDLIYLNSRCYNGLYRVNHLDEFNVSYDPSRKIKNILNERNINIVSYYLRKNRIKIKAFSFINSLNYIQENIARCNNDKIFFVFDPPYLNSFANYNYLNDWNRQKYEDLLEFIKTIEKIYSNLKFLLFNTDCSFISDLFKNYYQHKIQVQRSVSCKAKERKKANELIITNYRIKSLIDFIGVK